jgi:hypothetical protein
MFILGTKRSETAPNLAFHLKDCEGGYYLPEEEDFVVNYGRIGVCHKTDLNRRVENNKYKQLVLLREKEIPVPDHIPINNCLFENLHKRFPISKYTFPWIARRYKHSRGTDAIFLKSKRSLRKRKCRVLKRDYLVRYIPKIEEFRVHILGGEVGGISKKFRKEDIVKYHPHIWSRKRGWIQLDYDGELKNKLVELAINSCRALGYDFGAVDIISGEKRKLYVLEINSAPRLNRRRRKIYAKYFRKEWKKKMEVGSCQ